MPNNVSNASFMNPYAEEQAAIERRRALAGALQGQSMQPIESGMAGGWVTPVSPFQGLTKLAQAGAGVFGQKQADEKQKALGERSMADYKAMVAKGLRELQGSPGSQQPGADLGGGPAQPAQAPDPMGAMATFAGNPMGHAMLPLALGQMPEKPKPFTLKKDEVRFDANGQPISFGNPAPEKPEGFSLPPGNTRYDAQGKPIVTAPDKPLEQQPLSLATVVDPSDPTRMLQIDARRYKGGSVGSPGVIGISGKEPTFAKREEQLAGGKDQVDSLVSTLRDFYTKLGEGSGITDPSKGFGSNIGASIKSSSVGQTVGGIFGTENQSIRNSIAQQRPLLLNAIKNATGMSAKQMDSNAEMKLYLSAATDPKLDIKANMAALDKLESMFGSGKKGGGGELSPAEKAELEALRKRFGR